MDRWEETRNWLFDMEDTRVMVASHRGKFSSSVIENTSLAFSLAMAEGADMVEMDLARTQDGELVGHHDKTMARLFHRDEKISDFTWKELKELPLYNYVGEICVERLETFGEILDGLKGKALFALDKCWDHWEQVYPMLAERGMVEQAIFKFYIEDEAACRFAQTHPDCLFTPMIKTVEALDQVDSLRRHASIPVLEIVPKTPEDGIFQPQVFQRLHDSGIKVWCNSLSLARRLVYGAGYDDLKSIRQGGGAGWGVLAQAGVDVIQTDWPYEVRQYLTSIGRRSL